MKTIIAGSRDIVNPNAVLEAIRSSGWWHNVTEVVSGRARGVDRLGEWWAGQRSLPIKRFPANWKMFGKSAGCIRNREMAEYAEALIAVWDGASNGTGNMIDEARKRGLKVYVHNLSTDGHGTKET